MPPAARASRQPLGWPIADPACRHLVPVAREAMAEALGKQGVALPVLIEPATGRVLEVVVGRHLR